LLNLIFSQEYQEQSDSASEPGFCPQPDEQLPKKLKTESDSQEVEKTWKDFGTAQDLKKDYITSYSLNQTAGHTGFLTIAVKYE